MGAHLLFHRGRNDPERRGASCLYTAACDDAAIEIEESETHYETIQEIASSENEGRATVRIHSVDDDNYRMIADNGPTSETNETLN